MNWTIWFTSLLCIKSHVKTIKYIFKYKLILSFVYLIKGAYEMKRMLLILLMILMVVNFGCRQDNNSKVLESKTWKNVVNQEWSAGGRGFYFHEENGTAYSTYMIYGSGVRVARHYKSEVSITDHGNILIALPENMSSPDFESVDKPELVEVLLNVEDHAIIFDDDKFEVHEGVNNFVYILEDTK